MKFIFLVLIGFLNLFNLNKSLHAAEKINIKFEEMIIPISIEQLSKLGTYKEDSSELTDWFNSNALGKIFELSKILEYPVFKERGFSKQILESWIGRKVISQLGDTIIVPNDKDGIIVFNTIKNLLEVNKEVSTLDVLKAIPNKEIELDIDNLILIFSSWKKDLYDQQNLIDKLNQFAETEKYSFIEIDEKNKIIRVLSKELDVMHREKPLSLELWKPDQNTFKDLIIFMPGLGGDIKNFQWIAMELSKRGWPVIIIDHEGSNASALMDVINGVKTLPDVNDVFLKRFLDLDSVINAHKNNQFDLDNKSYILMGHSLGSLIAFLYEGSLTENDFELSCINAFNDFALTNLSKLLQCQLSEISLPELDRKSDLSGIVGFNSFGSLIWPKQKKSGVEVPVLLIGGTFDLITPLMGEQFNMFLSNANNSLNRFLVVEGASHFSPIRVTNQNLFKENGDDVFQINAPFIGTDPINVQKLSIEVILQFLYSLEGDSPLLVSYNQNKYQLNFHILDEDDVKNIFKD